MTHETTLRQIEPVTHDTYRLVLDRPDGYGFEPGQSCDLALGREGWRDQARTFSFTSLPDEDRLEFIIKSYRGRSGKGDGVTAQIPSLEPGETVTLGDPKGRIRDRGPGIFLAGGAGITPFVPILRRRARDGDMITACSLIYSNRTEDDIILRDEWEAMEGLSTIFTATRQEDTVLRKCRIDTTFIDENIKGFRDVFYVCGPREMTRALVECLRARSVPDEKIVRDQI